MTEEKAIKRCEELIKPKHANWIGISNQEAIRELLNKSKEKRQMTVNSDILKVKQKRSREDGNKKIRFKIRKRTRSMF